MLCERHIQKVEAQVKELKRTVELNEPKVEEGERKIKVLASDAGRIGETADALEKRAAHLQETISSHGENLGELEEREEAFGERDAVNAETVSLLERKVKEAEVRGDEAERVNGVMNVVLSETRHNVQFWMRKNKELCDSIVMMDNIADDPRYEVFVKCLDILQPCNMFKEKRSLWTNKELEDSVAVAGDKESDGDGSSYEDGENIQKANRTEEKSEDDGKDPKRLKEDIEEASDKIKEI